MPWHLLGSPSSQLGTLQAVVERAGLACRSYSLYLAFADFARRQDASFSLDDYGRVCSEGLNIGLGEWLFATPQVRRASAERDERYRELCRATGIDGRLLARLEALRELVPQFLERCADEILADDPAFVGFTLVYSQTLPSAALAQVLERRAPELPIVFGGTSCEGPMGPALLRAFPQVDLVVRGEAELVLPPLARALVEGAPLPELPGVCARDDAAIVARPMDAGARVRMDDVPLPVFDEYFERLAHSALSAEILPQLPLETARGCWWGEKQHCTFCGLNGLEMRFRSKSAERVLAEIDTLAERHGVLDFTSVDNMLDLRYLETVLGPLERRRGDLTFFFETKSNLREEQVAALRAGGVSSIQPGIESLSTPILERMRKGVTAFQNIRLLKWCAQYGIRPIWNLLYGFPGEDPAEYERMARLVPALTHLTPPSMGPLMLYRFSPYHERPAEHGIELGEPLPYHELVYDADRETLRELAQVFELRYLDGRDPQRYVGALREQVERWQRDAARNLGALTYRRGPGFVVVTDTRTTSQAARYVLSGEEAAVFTACDSGATLKSIVAAVEADLGHALALERALEILTELCDARLCVEERGRYLALALPHGARALAAHAAAHSR